MSEEFSGYAIDKEDREFLATLPGGENLLAMRGSYEEVRLDPREILKVENQGQQGACAGHSLSTILEWIYAIATGGERIQLSRAMAYYETQRIDGIRGDNGSTIGGGYKLASTVGLCREAFWQYPRSYDSSRPRNWPEILSDAAINKIVRGVRIRSYDEYRVFVGSGQGGVHNGIAWGNGMNRAVVESFSPGGGGHAIAGLCLSERVDTHSRPYVWIANSWGEQFGSREHPGWQEWSPTAIEQMLRHQWTEMLGLSDMPAAKPRKFSLEDWKARLRS